MRKSNVQKGIDMSSLIQWSGVAIASAFLALAGSLTTAHAQAVRGEAAVPVPPVISQDRINRGNSALRGSRLDNPMVDGVPVDHCATWAADCGQGGADQLCRRNGMGTATGWDVYRPGRTLVLGNNRVCQGGDCTAFRYVQCGGSGGAAGVARLQPAQVNGIAVDHCATWAENCGQGGADQYCAREGFGRARNWELIRPGRTWVMGSNRICEGGDCQGFRYVDCERANGVTSTNRRRFDSPMRNGMAVDHCARWADGCGQAGADQFCQMQGYARAERFETRRMGRTWVEGSRRVCDGGNCMGLRMVECSGTVNNAGWGASGGQTFANPTENGLPVDRCATWGEACGQGGADQFCQRQGYARASFFETYNPGRTWVPGSSRVCDGGDCQALRNVQCSR